MPPTIGLELARAAKERLAAEVRTRAWFRGIGVARDGDDWVVRLNVAKSALPDGESPPQECDGVPVEIVWIDTYSPRGR